MGKNDLTILLDMDGVVADFVGGIATQVRGWSQPEDPAEYWPEHNDLVRHFNFHDQTDMWSYIDAEGPEFWSRLEILPWARRLWDVCHRYGKVLFCTSPSANPACGMGKMQWIQNFTNNSFFREFIITPRKEVCADSRTVLIDDTHRNCKKFRQAGGRAFLWPMPWNKDERPARPDMTMDEIFHDLEEGLRERLR